MSRRPGGKIRVYNGYGNDLFVHVPKNHPKSYESRPIYRSTIVGVTADLAYHNTRSDTPTPNDGWLDNTSKKLGVNAFIGVTNPVWRSQVALGLNATTIASGSEYSYMQPWLTAEKHAYNSIQGVTSHAEVYGHPTIPDIVVNTPDASTISITDDRAKARFLNKLDSILSSVEVGQDLGEYKETVHGVTNPLRALRQKTLSYLDWLLKAKRSFKNDKVSLAKALADSYLEWTFGWKPLALDIADAIVGLQNRSRQFNRVPISAGYKNVFAGSTADTTLSTDPYAFIKEKRYTKSQSSYTIRYKGAVNVKLQNGSLPVNQVLQLDLPHFVPTAWDLLPYSFIVDYFTNVGDVIRAYSARINQVAWVCKTTRTVHRNESLHRLVDSNSQVGFPWSIQGLREDGQNSWAQRKDFSRTPVSPGTLTRIGFHFEMPNSDKPWYNIGAILTSRLAHLVPLWGLRTPR